MTTTTGHRCPECGAPAEPTGARPRAAGSTAPPQRTIDRCADCEHTLGHARPLLAPGEPRWLLDTAHAMREALRAPCRCWLIRWHEGRAMVEARGVVELVRLMQDHWTIRDIGEPSRESAEVFGAARATANAVGPMLALRLPESGACVVGRLSQLCGIIQTPNADGEHVTAWEADHGEVTLERLERQIENDEWEQRRAELDWAEREAFE